MPLTGLGGLMLVQSALGPAAPTGVTPNTGSAGGGQSVTITGTGFTGATSATLGGAAISSFVVVNDTTITGVTAQLHGFPGNHTVDLVVHKPGGDGTDANAYVYQEAILSISPNDVDEDQWVGTAFTVTGIGFNGLSVVDLLVADNDLGVVNLGSVVIVNDTTITATGTLQTLSGRSTPFDVILQVSNAGGYDLIGDDLVHVWNPDLLTDQLLHLDVDRGVTTGHWGDNGVFISDGSAVNGHDVGLWMDQSGLGSTASGVGPGGISEAPTYQTGIANGHAGIHWPNSHDRHLDGIFGVGFPSDTVTLYVVGQIAADNQALFDADENASSTNDGFSVLNTAAIVARNHARDDSLSPTYGANMVVTQKATPSAVTVYKNATAGAGNATGSSAVNVFYYRLGKLWAFGFGMEGYIFEVIVLVHASSDAERTRTVNFLRRKYGI